MMESGLATTTLSKDQTPSTLWGAIHLAPWTCECPAVRAGPKASHRGSHRAYSVPHPYLPAQGAVFPGSNKSIFYYYYYIFTIKDGGKEGIKYLSLILILRHQVVLSVQQGMEILPSLPLAVDVFIEIFIVVLYPSGRVQL